MRNLTPLHRRHPRQPFFFIPSIANVFLLDFGKKAANPLRVGKTILHLLMLATAWNNAKFSQWTKQWIKVAFENVFFTFTCNLFN